VQTINSIQNWLLFILLLGALALEAWALIDCVSRKGPAFPAAGKLTKPTWILLTALSLAGTAIVPGGVRSVIAWIGLTICSVYLADVRPAVREISGPSRW
jgi:hypothetical protein